MGAPAGTVTQETHFQGSCSVATGAIQPPLSLRALSSGHSSSPQTAHAASAVPGGWPQSLWQPEVQEGGPVIAASRRADATCLLCSIPLNHLGQDKSGHSPALTLHESPRTTELLGVAP